MYLLALLYLSDFYVSGSSIASSTHLWPLDNVSFFYNIKGDFTLPDSYSYSKCTVFADGHPITKTKSVKLTGSDTSFIDTKIMETNLLSQNIYTLAFFFYQDDFSNGTILHMTVPYNETKVCSMKLVSSHNNLNIIVTARNGVCGHGHLLEDIKASTWNIITIKKVGSLMTLLLNSNNVTFNTSSCQWKNMKENITTMIRLGGDASDIFDRIRGRIQCMALYDRLIDLSSFVNECKAILQDKKTDYWSCLIDNQLPNRVFKFRLSAVNHRPAANIAPISTLSSSHEIFCARACVALKECKAFLITASSENCRMYDFVELRSLKASIGDQYYVLRYL